MKLLTLSILCLFFVSSINLASAAKPSTSEADRLAKFESENFKILEAQLLKVRDMQIAFIKDSTQREISLNREAYAIKDPAARKLKNDAIQPAVRKFNSQFYDVTIANEWKAFSTKMSQRHTDFGNKNKK
jgi:hypothetical protein